MTGSVVDDMLRWCEFLRMNLASASGGDYRRARESPDCLAEFLLGFHLCFFGDAACVDNNEVLDLRKSFEQAETLVLI